MSFINLHKLKGKSNAKKMNDFHSSRAVFSATASTFEIMMGFDVDPDNTIPLIDNLYAIIMPAGHGKTNRAKELGIIDVDDVVMNNDVIEHLHSMRMDLIKAGSDEMSSAGWADHNALWYKLINERLSMVHFAEKQFILVHTEEAAHQIGATPVIALLLNEDVHNSAISRRSPDAQIMSRVNRKVVLSRTRHIEYIEFDSFAELNHSLYRIVGSTRPIARPFLFGRFDGCVGYGNVPDFIMNRFPITDDEIGIMYKLWHDGMVPDACVAAFEKTILKIESVESRNAENFEYWLPICDRILMCRRDPVDIDYSDVDLFDVFPHPSTTTKVKAAISLRSVLDQIGISNYTRMILNAHNGEDHNFVTSLVVAWEGILSTMSPLVVKAVVESDMLLVNQDDYVSIHKEIHNIVRTSSTLFGVDLTEEEKSGLMYSHLLMGKSPYSITQPMLEAEVIKRQRDLNNTKLSYDGNNWSSVQYNIDMDTALDSLYNSMVARKTDSRVDHGFEDFYTKRSRWGAAGSIGVADGMLKGTYEVKFLDGFNTYLSTGRHNKKSMLERDDIYDHIVTFLKENRGFNRTIGVAKGNEPGGIRSGGRVLFPGAFYHYVLFCYLLEKVERMGQIGASRMNAEGEDIYFIDSKIEMDSNDSKFFKFMYDFADFNSQHSSDDMKKVISAMNKYVVMSSDMYWASQWLIESFDKMEIDTDSGICQVKSGLYSGWRGTTFVNTVLNNAYIIIADLNYQRIYSSSCITAYDGTGDDVYLRTTSMVDASRLYDVMTTMGLEAKTIKQMFSSEKAEFLRVMYGKGSASTCVLRGIGSYVSGNIEGRDKMSYTRLRESVSNAKMLGRRGLSENITNTLVNATIKHLGRVKKDDVWLNLDKRYLHGSVWCGGMGIADENGFVYELSSKIPERTRPDVVVPAHSATIATVNNDSEYLLKMGVKLVVSDNLISTLSVNSYPEASNFQMFEDGINYCEIDANIKITNKIASVYFEPNIDYVKLTLDNLDRSLSIYNKLSKWEQVSSYCGHVMDLEGNKINNDELFFKVTGYNAQGIDYEKFGKNVCPNCPEYWANCSKKVYVAMYLTREVETIEAAELMYHQSCNAYCMVYPKMKM